MPPSASPSTEPADLAARFLELPAILAAIQPEARALLDAYARRVMADPGWLATSRETRDLLEVSGLGPAFAEMGRALGRNPESLARAQTRYWQDGLRLMLYLNRRLAGQAPETMIEPGPTDRRFSNPAWQAYPVFDVIKQQYLLNARWMTEAMAGATAGNTLDGHQIRKARFFVERMIESMSPTNALFTNPVALSETLNTRGENLIRGLRMLIEDLELGNGRLAVRTSQQDDFRLGQDLAATPGKVVFRNRLMELIQYAPATAKVRKTPLLIVPPWINKYYILDLRSENSFIKWAVDQGLTVFVISWVNPGPELAEMAFDNYMTEGPLAAVDAITRITGEQQVGALGYCIGGTLLAAMLAYMGLKGDRRVKSATFLTTLLDFSDVGDIDIFLDEAQFAVIEKHMAKKGILEGSEMGAAFAIMRARDTIWPFVVNNYLLGKKPPAFDILYWNADNTNMPRNMHSFYLRNMYLENNLREPGGIDLLDTPIDLGEITQPAYFMAAEGDHIAPWRSVYAGAQCLKGPTRFVLAASGHVAGVVNPPASRKYAHWTPAAGDPAMDGAAWRSSAREHAGSWWPDWGKWIAKQSGAKTVAARQPGGGKPTLGPAPGSYVLKRCGENG